MSILLFDSDQKQGIAPYACGLIYVISALIASYSIWKIYYRVKHPFWSTQPVFHYNSLRYWIAPPGIISFDELPATKYYDPFHVSLYKSDKISPSTQKDCVELIQNHYLKDRDVHYDPPSKHILAHCNGHNGTCWWSIFHTTTVGVERKRQSNVSEGQLAHNVIPLKRAVSCLMFRPTSAYLREKGSSQLKKMNYWYVDFLVTHKDHRGIGIAPKLIYTTCKSLINKERRACLFKREGQQAPFVPLVRYVAYTYDIKYWKRVPSHTHYKLSLISVENFALCQRFLEEQRDNGSKLLFVCGDMSHIKELVVDGVYDIFLLHHKDSCIGCYVWRRSHMTCHGDPVMECVGSLVTKEAPSVWASQWANVIDFLKNKRGIRYITIENISDNKQAVAMLQPIKKCISKTLMSYSLYNCALRPYLPKDTFILL